MSTVKTFLVTPCSRKEITDFIEYWHYSHNINGVISDYCFKLIHNGQMIGAMIYGRIAMANVWKKYTKKPEELIELRRLCCIDNTPKNTESYFIGKTLKWLKQNTSCKTVISYADETYGHTGVIYRASNFTHAGITSPGRMIAYNNKLYHDKAIRTTYKGNLKPFAKKLKEALETGEAKYTKTKGKHIYLYQLRRDKS